MKISTTETQQSDNGVSSGSVSADSPHRNIRKKAIRRTVKGKITSRRLPKKFCDICNKPFKNKNGVTMHKIRMHNDGKKWNNKPKISELKNNSKKYFEKIEKLWLELASTEKNSSASKAIIECLLDLAKEIR